MVQEALADPVSNRLHAALDSVIEWKSMGEPRGEEGHEFGVLIPQQLARVVDLAVSEKGGFHRNLERAGRAFTDGALRASHPNKLDIALVKPRVEASSYRFNFPFAGKWYPDVYNPVASDGEYFICHNFTGRVPDDFASELDPDTCADLVAGRTWMIVGSYVPSPIEAPQYGIATMYLWDREAQSLALRQASPYEDAVHEKDVHHIAGSVSHVNIPLFDLGTYQIPGAMTEAQFVTNLAFPFRTPFVGEHGSPMKLENAFGFDVFGIQRVDAA